MFFVQNSRSFMILKTLLNSVSRNKSTRVNNSLQGYLIDKGCDLLRSLVKRVMYALQYLVITMWFNILLLVALCSCVEPSDDNDEPVLYYYGLEESERSLPSCNARQACSALVLRYWRAPALVRLCRCARRMRCDTRATNDSLVELNNRAHLQFCQPVTDWRECAMNETALNIVSTYQRMNPDELEQMHHVNMQLVPPNIRFSCRCRNPNYWKLISRDDTNHTYTYRCSSLPLCKTGEFCGNVNYDLNALYQSCLCPRHHICVHNGGITHTLISELLYEGRGWKAYCQRIEDDYSYEDY